MQVLNWPQMPLGGQWGLWKMVQICSRSCFWWRLFLLKEDRQIDFRQQHMSNMWIVLSSWFSPHVWIDSFLCFVHRFLMLCSVIRSVLECWAELLMRVKSTAVFCDKSGFRATRRIVLSAVQAEQCVCVTESRGLMLQTLLRLVGCPVCPLFLRHWSLHHHHRHGFLFPVARVADNQKFLQLPHLTELSRTSLFNVWSVLMASSES